jgi:hypothetical protein
MILPHTTPQVKTALHYRPFLRVAIRVYFGPRRFGNAIATNGTPATTMPVPSMRMGCPQQNPMQSPTPAIGTMAASSSFIMMTSNRRSPAASTVFFPTLILAPK